MERWRDGDMEIWRYGDMEIWRGGLLRCWDRMLLVEEGTCPEKREERTKSVDEEKWKALKAYITFITRQEEQLI